MEKDKIRDWVRQKLQEGQDREMIQRSLEQSGHDPSIVDEVMNQKQESVSAANKPGLAARLHDMMPEISFSPRKIGIAVIIFVLTGILVAGGNYALQNPPEILSFETGQTADEPAEKNPGEKVVTVEIKSVAEPARAEISRSQGLRFVNKREVEMRFEFERNIETFTLEPGKSRTVDIDELVYYTATPVSGSGSLHGSVVVN